MKNALQKAKDKGAKIKIAVPFTKENTAAVKQLGTIAQVKNINSVSARVCIVDGKNVVIMPMNDKEIHSNYDFGIWLNTDFFGKSMESMFESVWSKA